MSELGPESGGGLEEEAWIRTQLADVVEPDINLDDDDDINSADLYLTMEDYDRAEDVALDALVGSELIVAMEGGVVQWTALGMYLGNLVVRQAGGDFADGTHVMVGGSIYIPVTFSDNLKPEEEDFLPTFAWDDDTEDYEIGKTMLGTPYVIGGGYICKGAHLYYRPAFLPDEMRRPQLVEKSLQEPLLGAVIAVEQRPGKTTSLFVSERGFMTPRIRSLHRIDGEEIFQRL